jgi:hypothetical protein
MNSPAIQFSAETGRMSGLSRRVTGAGANRPGAKVKGLRRRVTFDAVGTQQLPTLGIE